MMKKEVRCFRKVIYSCLPSPSPVIAALNRVFHLIRGANFLSVGEIT
jgi:hypothetical protein